MATSMAIAGRSKRDRTGRRPAETRRARGLAADMQHLHTELSGTVSLAYGFLTFAVLRKR
jgi:hypothetical protein